MSPGGSTTSTGDDRALSLAELLGEKAKTTTVRLLPLAKHHAAENMAIDDAIAKSVAEAIESPTLRLYSWCEPTLSLGYFQTLESALRAYPEVSSRPAIVRRCTGGGAILHEHELTYSLTLPIRDTHLGAREAVYESVHRIIIDTLANFAVTATRFGSTSDRPGPEQNDESVPKLTAGLRQSKANEPFLCFQRRTSEDLICSGYKILGSAQRRIRGGLLQHGSLLLSVAPSARALPGIAQLTGKAISTEQLASELITQLGKRLDVRWRSGELSQAEKRDALRIAQDRYAADEWTRRR